MRDIANVPCRKISIISSSHGAALALLSMHLATNEAKYVSQVIALESCLVPQNDGLLPDLTAEQYRDAEQALNGLGVNSLFGPDWETRVRQACFFFG